MSGLLLAAVLIVVGALAFATVVLGPGTLLPMEEDVEGEDSE